MKSILRSFALVAFVLSVAVSCSGEGDFSAADKLIINSSPDNLLHIYTIDDPAELEVLRARSTDLSRKALHSEEFALLSERMIHTVSDSITGGVGLAAPQIGINKAVVAVQRFDKDGAPFEVYPNISIVSYSQETTVSREGCLSIPGKRDSLDRSVEVEIEYYSIPEKKMLRDTVQGYTAIIFQHETDHLDGILYTDRAK